MDIIEKYESLAAAGKWQDALPVIEEIININPDIDTSWFNYGVCLDELGRHGSAAEAFIKAHEFKPSDSGIHYRIFRSFFLANDLDQTFEFCNYLCESFKDIRETLFGSEEFRELTKYELFRKLEAKYSK
ncbi:MAG: tetratricopeptide repeat protein [Planctomycetes bacterium]|nr:tetratricopeptide repeat protein [Planctomycetota bacterium]